MKKKKTIRNVRIWIISTDGQILLKDSILQLNGPLDLNQATVIGPDLTSAIKEIEEKYKILVCSDDLEREYFESYKTDSLVLQTDVYFLELDLTGEEKMIISESSNCRFYDIGVVKKFIKGMIIKSSLPPRLEMFIHTLLHKFNY